MIASIRRKKPHVYRVIILKQMADHSLQQIVFCDVFGEEEVDKLMTIHRIFGLAVYLSQYIFQLRWKVYTSIARGTLAWSVSQILLYSLNLLS